eukprot:scaffold99_cov382-Prasinococcus_capsulatus_cf.AAC.9
MVSERSVLDGPCTARSRAGPEQLDLLVAYLETCSMRSLNVVQGRLQPIRDFQYPFGYFSNVGVFIVLPPNSAFRLFTDVNQFPGVGQLSFFVNDFQSTSELEDVHLVIESTTQSGIPLEASLNELRFGEFQQANWNKIQLVFSEILFGEDATSLLALSANDIYDTITLWNTGSEIVSFVMDLMCISSVEIAPPAPALSCEDFEAQFIEENTILVYDDALAPGWSDLSWSAVINFQEPGSSTPGGASPPFEGEFSIYAAPVQGFGALRIITTTPFTAAHNLTFAISDGSSTQGFDSIYLLFESQGDLGPSLSVPLASVIDAKTLEEFALSSASTFSVFLEVQVDIAAALMMVDMNADPTKTFYDSISWFNKANPVISFQLDAINLVPKPPGACTTSFTKEFSMILPCVAANGTNTTMNIFDPNEPVEPFDEDVVTELRLAIADCLAIPVSSVQGSLVEDPMLPYVQVDFVVTTESLSSHFDLIETVQENPSDLVCTGPYSSCNSVQITECRADIPIDTNFCSWETVGIVNPEITPETYYMFEENCPPYPDAFDFTEDKAGDADGFFFEPEDDTLLFCQAIPFPNLMNGLLLNNPSVPYAEIVKYGADEGECSMVVSECEVPIPSLEDGALGQEFSASIMVNFQTDTELALRIPIVSNQNTTEAVNTTTTCMGYDCIDQCVGPDGPVGWTLACDPDCGGLCDDVPVCKFTFCRGVDKCVVSSAPVEVGMFYQIRVFSTPVNPALAKIGISVVASKEVVDTTDEGSELFVDQEFIDETSGMVCPTQCGFVIGGGLSSFEGPKSNSGHPPCCLNALIDEFAFYDQLLPAAGNNDLLMCMSTEPGVISGDSIEVGGDSEDQVLFNILSIVFDEDVNSPWVDYSWNTDTWKIYNNGLPAQPVWDQDNNIVQFPGTVDTVALLARVDTWGALRFVASEPVLATENAVLRFYIRPIAGKYDADKMKVYVGATGSLLTVESFPLSNYANVVDGVYTMVDVPLLDFVIPTTPVAEVLINNAGGQQAQFYIENMMIIEAGESCTSNLCIFGRPAASPLPIEDKIVYSEGDSLTSSFYDWSWATIVNYGTTEQAYLGEQSIQASVQGFGAFRVVNSPEIDGFWGTLSFAILPIPGVLVQSNQSPQFGLPDLLVVAKSNIPSVANFQQRLSEIVELKEGTWTLVNINLPKDSTFHEIMWYNMQNAVANFFIDEIVISTNAPAGGVGSFSILGECDAIYGGSGAPILDLVKAKSSLYVTEDISLKSIEVELFVEHPQVQDLAVYIQSPTHTSLLVPTETTTGANYDGTVFSTEGGLPVPGGADAPYNGEFKPWQNDFSQFEGQTTRGVWRLIVVDSNNNGVEGELQGWNLRLCS